MPLLSEPLLSDVTAAIKVMRIDNRIYKGMAKGVVLTINADYTINVPLRVARELSVKLVMEVAKARKFLEVEHGGSQLPR